MLVRRWTSVSGALSFALLLIVEVLRTQGSAEPWFSNLTLEHGRAIALLAVTALASSMFTRQYSVYLDAVGLIGRIYPQMGLRRPRGTGEFR